MPPRYSQEIKKMEPWWLDVDPYFKPVIDLHDAFETSGKFDEWRKKFVES